MNPIIFAYEHFVHTPLYNLLMVLLDIIPGADMGLAVIALTLFVKLLLFPFSIKATRSQIKLKAIQPELKAIQTKYADNKETQAMMMMDLYKREKVNPFSGFGILFLQLPVVIALYRIFTYNGLPEIKFDLLYPFVSAPESIGTGFLGLVDLTIASLPLALVVGLTQFIQIRIINQRTLSTGAETKNDPQAAAMQSATKSMQYVMPVLITVIAARFPSVVALYWITSNLFAIGQELWVKHKLLSTDSHTKA